MNRVNLMCRNCKSQDFEVEIHMIPRGISIACNKCGCTTPLVVMPESMYDSALLPVNDEMSEELYDKSYYEEISPKIIREFKDCMEKSKNDTGR